MKLNMSGKWFNVVSYGLNDKEEIDYDQVEKLAEENKPKIIIAGASAYSLHIDFKRFSEIAKKGRRLPDGRYGALCGARWPPEFIRLLSLTPIS